MSEVLFADRLYKVMAKCPSCGQLEVIRLGMVSRLDQTSAGAHLGLKVKSDSVDHMCNQIPFPIEGGELPGQTSITEDDE